MYPQQFFSLRQPFPINNTVFVAMPFDESFRRRYVEVIAPAIRSIRRGGVPLEPHRVDVARVSDSILTEILSQIGQARLVFCDISPIGRLDDRAVRNGNVMYEVGIAHAVRQPQEVVMFRSDGEGLLFDLSNIRVNRYDPDGDPASAKKTVMEALVEALREVDARFNLSVRRAAASLDYVSWSLLLSTSRGPLEHPIIRTMRDVMSKGMSVDAIGRMLQAGILEAEWAQASSETMDKLRFEVPERGISYRVTEFGQAVRAVAIERLREAPAVRDDTAHKKGASD